VIGRISFRAVVIVFVLSLGASWITSNLLLALMAGDAINPGMSDDDTRAAIKVIADSSAFLLPWLCIGTGISVGAGYFTARLAKDFPLYNGLAIGIVSFVFDLFFIGESPVWFEVVGMSLTIPSCIYGANLARKRLRAST
jgi:hypothetical protein